MTGDRAGLRRLRLRRVVACNVIWRRWNEYRSWRPRVLAHQADFTQVAWAWFTFTVEFATERADV